MKFYCVILSLLLSSAWAIEPNRPILDLPLVNQKIITAHYMTGDIDYQQPSGGLSRNLDFFDPKGSFQKVGGINQVAPMDMFLYERGERDLETLVEQELKAAILAGIDAFQFYYTNHDHPGFIKRYNEIIIAFFKVGKEKFPDFKFTLCLCHPGNKGQDKNIEQWVSSLSKIFDEVGDFDNWLRSADGRYIFYLWNADGLAEKFMQKPWEIDQYPESLKNVANAYEELADSLGQPIAYIYDFRFPKNKKLTAEIIKYFPAIWTWTENLNYLNEVRETIKLCKDNKRTFSISFYPDYYTSKIYWKDKTKGHNLIWENQLHGISIDNVERHYQNTGLTEVFRTMFGIAIEEDLNLINLITWNDYPEGHHIAPEINHNFAAMVLLNYYKSILKKESIDRETIAVFYKKYPREVKPEFDIKVYTKRTVNDPSLEDYIEIVAIVKESTEIFFKEKSIGIAESGFNLFRVPLELGTVEVNGIRDEHVVLELKSPQPITDSPFRTDRLTYMYSTDFDYYFNKIYGNSKKISVKGNAENGLLDICVDHQ